MYANVADGMRFLSRDDFTLTPGLGEIAAEAFRDETEMPATLRRAVLDDTDVAVSTLAAWGERAHVDGEVKPNEAKCLFDALHSNPVRSSMADLLNRHPWKSEKDTELARLARITRTLQKTAQQPALREAIECILAFESCYRLASLALERLLWLCRCHSAGFVTLLELNGDSVLQAVRENLPAQVRRFLNSLDNGAEPAFRQDLNHLSDVRKFLEETSAAVADIQTFVGVVISRHTDVQHGKFDRGRRKMPWLEQTDSRINLTVTRAGGLDSEATAPDDIAPHPYRLNAADALISASSKAPRP
jgi:hypothetical protein